MTKDDLPPLPDWTDGMADDPLSRFVYNNEPAGKDDEREFREQLTAALHWFALAAIAAHDAKREKDAERWRKLMTMSRGKVITICQRPETAFRHRPDAPWTLQEEVDAAIEREGA